MAVDSAQIAAPVTALAANAPAPAPGRTEQALFGDDGFTFSDLLDMVNPLQHIPLVSTFYRKASGDEIGGLARVVGGALLGGPIGLAFGLVQLASKFVTGKDLDDQLLALADAPLDDDPDPLVAVPVPGAPGENTAMIPRSQEMAYYAGQSLADSRVSRLVAQRAPAPLVADAAVPAGPVSPLDGPASQPAGPVSQPAVPVSRNLFARPAGPPDAPIAQPAPTILRPSPAAALRAEPVTLDALAAAKPVGFQRAAMPDGALPALAMPSAASSAVPAALRLPDAPGAAPAPEAGGRFLPLARTGFVAPRAPAMPALDAGWSVGPHVIARDAAQRYAVPRAAPPQAVDVAR